MLQIDHVYEFFHKHLFSDFDFYHLFDGVPRLNNNVVDDIAIFTNPSSNGKKIFFYDAEPILESLTPKYYEFFASANTNQSIFVTSEKSQLTKDLNKQYNFTSLYYFYHGFAALDWYRGFHALNYNNNIVREYSNDYTCLNRLIQGDRGYRNYLIAQLQAKNLLNNGIVSYNTSHDQTWDWEQEINGYTKLSQNACDFIRQQNIPKKIVGDNESVHGYASADIPREFDSFWNIVTETVFHYDKLHLTEKIFKPIVSKQPFMLVGAPGNLAYLKSYGFKTFDNVIDESYDTILDPDLRVEAVVAQIARYCSLNPADKLAVAKKVEDAVNYNFEWFYGGFKHKIARELVENVRKVRIKLNCDINVDELWDAYQALTK